jgi:zinc transport system substrate-binding protein
MFYRSFFLKVVISASLFFSLVGGRKLSAAESVLVTIAPYKYFVEKIGGDTVDVKLLVPKGADPHTFEASPRQAIQAVEAKLWFRMGEGVERQLLKVLQNSGNTMRVEDVREGMEMLEDDHGHGHKDPHMWLSPKLAAHQATHIARVLMQEQPAHKELYQKNLEKFLKELNEVDQKIASALAPYKGSVLFVSHPAFGYFAKDYGLKQLSLEHQGKEPSLKQLHSLINTVLAEKIQVIFLQEGVGKKAGEKVALELHLKKVSLDPLDEDYLENLSSMGFKIQEAFKGKKLN